MLRARQAAIHGLFLLSGAAGLGYQMTWTRMFATGLGHETPAMLAIVGAFMGGMAAGAWWLDGRIARSAHPGRWYAALEAVIGLWAFASILLIPLGNTSAVRLIGIDPSPLRHWTFALIVPFVVLLPSTIAMGATFPAMERLASRFAGDGRRVGAVYAVNTFGALAGTLGSTFLMVPALGFTKTVGIFGAVNFLCAGGAMALSTRIRVAVAKQESIVQQRPFTRRRLTLTVFVTGLLGIGFEVAGTRVLSQVLENTVYTFAAVLSVFLLGTAMGAALYQRFGRNYEPRNLLTNLLCAAAMTLLLGIFALARAPIFYAGGRRFGDGTLAVLAAEMLVAASVFLLPTVIFGALFSHLVQLARGESGGVGRAVAANTLGAALAPAVFGVGLLPVLGSKWTLALGALSYVALIPILRGRQWILPVGCLVLLPLLPVNLHIVSVPPGGHVTAFREGVMAAVAVVEDAAGERILRVNDRFQMGGTAVADAEYRHAHIPLLLHPSPRRALFLGLGTGITLGGAIIHPELEADGVELVPEILECLPFFEPENRTPQKQPGISLHVADARRFVRATSRKYDVVVADLFHPARDGAGALYTQEHFLAIRQRLAEGGLFCQWLPLHQLDESMLGAIVRTFASVFPHTHGILLRLNVDVPVLGLIGSVESVRLTDGWVESRLNAPALRTELKRLALADSLRLFGNFVDLKPLARSAGDLNTDDHPVVMFEAPRFAYDRTSPPYGRLLKLVANEEHGPGWLSFLEANEGFQRQLRVYMAARNVYLHGLAADYEGRRDDAIRAYLESARLSEDFTSGYAQCLTIASLLAAADPEKARDLLRQLIEAQPARPVAREFLERLEKEVPRP